jgi:hypothetical protein
MDPVQKAFLFHHWVKKQQLYYDSLRDQADAIGFYANNELYQKIKETEKNTISVSDEAFDDATRLVEEDVKKTKSPNNNASIKRRKALKIGK